MKRLSWLAALLLAPSLCHAAVGIGGSVRTDADALYMPIDVSPTFRLEPYLSYQRTTAGGGNGFSNTGNLLGVGGFARGIPAEHLEVYGGGRAGYVKARSSNSLTTTDQSGFRIEPTLGVAYDLNERVSVGLEEFFGYQHLTGTQTPFGGGVTTTSVGTGNRLLVRMMFGS